MRRRRTETMYGVRRSKPFDGAAMTPLVLWPICLALAFAGCGGGGGDSPPPPVPPPACSTGLSTPRSFPNLTFESPVAMTQVPLDASRWFVVEQAGLIRAFDNDESVPGTDDFLDLRARVSFSGESGMLGLAFHPDFAVNGRAFVNYSNLAGGTLRSITSEFTSPDGGLTLDPNSERVLLSVDKPASNHNGGNIAFGPDGLLYIGLGDGGGSGDPEENAQNPQRLLGKMLRIDVDAQPGGAPYGIPAGATGNPFAGNPLCNVDGTGAQDCPEIYALGFRNPWRWSFDRQNGELWVGDVGQAAFEEIDRVERGGNYGWDTREGAHCFEPMTGCATAGLTDPVAEYGRDLGISITGGYVYRGIQSTQVTGRYVFADFGGMIATLMPDGVDSFTVEPLVEQGCAPPDTPGFLQVSSFAEDLDGELYVLDYGRGHIRQLVFTD
jgi:glucose/arabinose dehydrogenase